MTDTVTERSPEWQGRYALFAALRRGETLPPNVVWALTELLTQVAVTVDKADAGGLTGDDASRGALLGWVDVLSQAEHKLTDEWTKQRGAAL